MPPVITPLTSNIGAEVTGVSGPELLNRRAADENLAALEQYGVIVYREVHISDEDLIAFSRMLGEVAVVPTGEHEYPEIQTITLDPSKTNALLASYRQGNLDRLLEWSTQPEYVLRHHWRRGDLVIWDNTGMLHRAMPFEPTSLRLMHRTTLVGEEAVA